jgi:hypothetical protein
MLLWHQLTNIEFEDDLVELSEGTFPEFLVNRYIE